MSARFVHEELSYKINGVLFDVHNNLGPGLKEKVYQKAVAAGFANAGIPFEEQVHGTLRYKDLQVGSYFLDFLVNGCVVVELKVGDRFSRDHIQQVYEYLKVYALELGILATFSSTGVKIKRIVNLE